MRRGHLLLALIKQWKCGIVEPLRICYLGVGRGTRSNLLEKRLKLIGGCHGKKAQND